MATIELNGIGYLVEQSVSDPKISMMLDHRSGTIFPKLLNDITHFKIKNISRPVFICLFDFLMDHV
jgi:hypothetical protein